MKTFDGGLVEADRRVKGVWHGIASLVSLFILAVVPVPVAAFLTPLVSALRIVVLLSVALLFILILTLLAFLRLFLGFSGLCRLCLFFLFRLSLFLCFLCFFRLLRLLFLVLFRLVLVPVIFGSILLGGGFSRQILAELGDDRVLGQPPQELLLDLVRRHIILLL